MNEQYKQLLKNTEVRDDLDTLDAALEHINSCYDAICRLQRMDVCNMAVIDLVDAVIHHVGEKTSAEARLEKFGITDDLGYLRAHKDDI